MSRAGIEHIETGSPGHPGRARSKGNPADSESRAIGASGGGIRIRSLHVPGGVEAEDLRHVDKLDWLARLRTDAKSWTNPATALVGVRDFSHRDEDVFDVAAPTHDTHLTQPEGAAFPALLDKGCVDAVRLRTPGTDVGTYRDHHRPRCKCTGGMRTQCMLRASPLAGRVTAAAVDHGNGVSPGAPDPATRVVDVA